MEGSVVTAPMTPWQQRTWERACDALDGGRMGHALLFAGPALLGKRALAERLAQRVLCTARAPGADACGACRSCRQFAVRAQRDPAETRPDGSLAHPDGHAAHPDLLLIGYEVNQKASPAKPRSEIVIDQMRALSQRFALTAQGEARVAIVEPADAVNYAAWNAILKTLEEPQPGRYLWLIASQPARLPATIRSRCQRLDMQMPAREESLAWLTTRGHAQAAAAEALDAARGHPGLADAWLRDGGMALRREIAGDLAQLAAGKTAVVQAAQRWTTGGDADLRLRFAADLALERAGECGEAGLTDPHRTRTLTAWFDAANRTRELLRTTVRADLAVAELLLAWRDGAQAHGATR